MGTNQAGRGAGLAQWKVFTTGAPLVVWATSESDAIEQVDALKIVGVRGLTARKVWR